MIGLAMSREKFEDSRLPHVLDAWRMAAGVKEAIVEVVYRRWIQMR